MSFDEIFDLTAGVYFNFYNIRALLHTSTTWYLCLVFFLFTLLLLCIEPAYNILVSNAAQHLSLFVVVLFFVGTFWFYGTYDAYLVPAPAELSAISETYVYVPTN